MRPGLVDLGYPDQALKRSHEALTLAQELSHPFSLAIALTGCCLAPSAPPGGAGRPESGQRQRLTLCDEQGFPYWLAGDYLAGLGAGRAGQEKEGIAQMRQGLAAYRATGAELLRPYFLPCWPRRTGRWDRQKKG